MHRIDPKALVDLERRTNELRTDRREWLRSALCAIALTAPLVRGRRKGAEEAMEQMLWTVGQCVTLGDRELAKDELALYSMGALSGFCDLLDDLIFEGLRLYGVAELVLPSLERMQCSDDPLFVPESWPQIREWWVQKLQN